jgi:hypothetical protein
MVVSTTELESLKHKLGGLQENLQLGILYICKTHNIPINESNNGSFINLSTISYSCYEELIKYTQDNINK